ncbi:hypothetical protein [Abyssisolibacter fermentans]|uniref:hypothetical protein n=1 Tax=Abyssisolibacter fermentans TaxID=1766203 RepID=UPI00082ECDE6|nr:hypothetical protein [Abyssisolibacter fermentans]
MVKKNLIFIIVISILSLLVISCGNNENSKIQSLVEKAEVLDNKFSGYEIDYDEYMRKIKDVFSNTYTEEKHLKRMGLHGDIDKEYYINVYENGIEKTMKFVKTLERNVEVKISKVYDFDENIKNVFTIAKIEFEDETLSEDGPLIITNRYYISKEENKWKITGHEKMQHTNKLRSANKKAFGKELMLTTFNNEPVEYVKTIYPDTLEY